MKTYVSRETCVGYTGHSVTVARVVWDDLVPVQIRMARIEIVCIQRNSVSHETKSDLVNTGAHSKVVLRGIRIAEARVRFPVSPQNVVLDPQSSRG